MNVLKGSPKTIDLASRQLKDEAIHALQLNDEQRITAVWGLKSQWIPYPLANSIFHQAEELLERAPAQRLPCVLAFGEPNTGKTSLYKRYLQRHPIELNLTGDAIQAKVIGVEIGGPEEGLFYDSLLAAVGAPFRGSATVEKKLHQVLQILSRIGTRQLLIDELNTAISGPLLKQKKFLMRLKFLANELGLTIFATGTQDAKLAIAVDAQISSRFKHVFELKPWTFDKEFRKLLVNFEERLPLRQASELQEPRLAMRLRDLSEGYMGDLAELLMQASALAIKTKTERIDLELLGRLNFKTGR
jgi:hypothetical protein